MEADSSALFIIIPNPSILHLLATLEFRQKREKNPLQKRRG